MKKITLYFAVLALSLPLSAYAQERGKMRGKHKGMMEMSAEHHEKMAKAHQEAASCLKKAKDDAAKAECRKKFRENFSGMKGMKKGMKKGMSNGMKQKGN